MREEMVVRSAENVPEKAEERREIVQEREWKMYCEVLELGREVVKRWSQSRIPPSLTDVVRVLELAARLGRMSAGMPMVGGIEVQGERMGIAVDIRVALEKAYGREMSPGAVVDVEVVKEGEKGGNESGSEGSGRDGGAVLSSSGSGGVPEGPGG